VIIPVSEPSALQSGAPSHPLYAVDSTVTAPARPTERMVDRDDHRPQRHGLPAVTSRDHVVRLLAQMRSGEERAWSAFMNTFRPVLTEFARRTGIPREFWDVCVDEVLADESTRLVSSSQPAPVDPTAYLLRAVRHKYLNLRRAATRRQRRYEQASDAPYGEGVITTVCSAYALRVSGSDGDAKMDGEAVEGVVVNGRIVAAGTSDLPNDATPNAARPNRLEEPELRVSEVGAAAVPEAVPDRVRTLVLRRVQDALVAATTKEERALLTWHADGVSHREIAHWLGISYAAAAKRLWRIRRRLHTVALAAAEAVAAEGVADLRIVLRVLEVHGT
jgi:DNA-directed RNA polymerase specialized sigma24 family protein